MRLFEVTSNSFLSANKIMKHQTRLQEICKFMIQYQSHLCSVTRLQEREITKV